MNDQSYDRNAAPSFFKMMLIHLPSWAAVFLGMAYAVGFLTQFLFYSRWGINHVSNDVFKAEYIHIGILAILPPTAIGTLIFVFFQLRRLGKEKILWEAEQLSTDTNDAAEGNTTELALTPDRKLPVDENTANVSPKGIILMCNLVFIFYVVVIFVPQSVGVTTWFQVPMIALPSIAVLGLSGIFFYSNKLRKQWRTRLAEVDEHKIDAVKREIVEQQKAWHSASEFVRSGFVTISLCLDGIIIWQFWHIFYFMFHYRWVPVLLYLFLSFIIGVYLIIVVKIGPQYSLAARPYLYLSATCVCVPLMYVAVVSFAFGVFPFIPSTRGGANYSEAPLLKLWLYSDTPIDNENDIKDRPLWLISETDKVIYLATDDTPTDQASSGQSNTLAQQPQDHSPGPTGWFDPKTPPRIIVISRDQVAGWSFAAK